MLRHRIDYRNTRNILYMHYFISVGEPSGDIHAAELIARLKELDPQARFTFLGGDLMTREAGTDPVIHYRDMAFMGFSEVLRNLRTIFGNLSKAKRAIIDSHCQALILVDYPSFNLKLARFATRHRIPVYYYISPKVWAWKEWRVKQLRRYVRRLYSILPFEVEFFRRHSMEVQYVGNPSLEEVDRRLSGVVPLDEFLRRHHLAPRPILALVPGSRRGEIRNNLPIMDAVARRPPDLQPVIAAAPGMDESFYRQYSTFPLVTGATFELMKYAEAALVTSGTATLECALAGTPQVVCYRANGVKLSYNIMKHLIKSPFVSLPNLIAGREVIPEMLVHLCTVDSVDARLCDILPGAPGRQLQLDGYRDMRSRLGVSLAGPTAARLIYDDLTRLTHTDTKK